MGEIFRVFYRRIGNEKWLSLIFKKCAQHEWRRNQILIAEYFSREIQIYEKILPSFNQIQLTKGIDIKTDGFNECAHCYFALKEPPFECLFLEDFKVNQFEVFQQHKEPLTFDHVSLVMKALGKFHAISFALRDQQPALFAEITSNLKEIYWTTENNQFLIGFFDKMKNIAIHSLNENGCHELLRKYKQAFKNGFAETARACVTSQIAEPYAVICHGITK